MQRNILGKVVVITGARIGALDRDAAGALAAELRRATTPA